MWYLKAQGCFVRSSNQGNAVWLLFHKCHLLSESGFASYSVYLLFFFVLACFMKHNFTKLRSLFLFQILKLYNLVYIKTCTYYMWHICFDQCVTCHFLVIMWNVFWVKTFYYRKYVFVLSFMLLLVAYFVTYMEHKMYSVSKLKRSLRFVFSQVFSTLIIWRNIYWANQHNQHWRLK